MKNFYILLLITVIILSGCSKASQTGSAVEAAGIATTASTTSVEPSSSSVYAYIPYCGGKVEAYRLEGGNLLKIKEYDAGHVSSLAATPDGKYLYAIHPAPAFLTKYEIDANGELSNPVQVTLELPEGGISGYVFDLSRNILFISLTGRKLDETKLGSVVALRILPDGSLEKISTTSVPGDVNQLTMSPSGKYLFADTGKGITEYKIGTKGELIQPFITGIDTNNRMELNGDGSLMLIDINSETSQLGVCSVGEEQIKLISSIDLPYAQGTDNAFSMAFDDNQNMMAINLSKWLCVYRLENSKLIETNRYMMFKTHKVLNKAEAEQQLLLSQEYRDAYENFSDDTAYVRERRAMNVAVYNLPAHLSTVLTGPDGYIYVGSTSGVYRFKSTSEGLVFDSAVAIWTDTERMYRGKDRAPAEEQGNYEPIPDGMIFVQRK